MAKTVATSGERLALERAFDRLVARELPSAYRTAALLLGDATEAEDVTQDALERAWQRWDQLRDPDHAGAWFGRILVNLCRDRLRSPRRRPVRWIGEPQAPDATSSVTERDALDRAIAGMNADQRIVLVLRYYLDLPVEAIAERTGAPVGTVKSRLRLALDATRAAYEAQERAGETR
jgi:RNA polymerase sigma-70 factor (sigma-E family)